MTREGLKEIHSRLEGLGYLPVFEGSKNLRDMESGVKIEFLITGGYPGDGKPKAVSFPDPKEVGVEKDGITYLKLPTLIELKIASGITNSERIKDLADVQELIKALNLPSTFSANLDPFVREKYEELWNAARPPMKRFVKIWRNRFLTVDAASLEAMISSLQQAVVTLQAMLADGVIIDPERGTTDSHVYLVTTDPEIAKKYGMHDESEFLDESKE